MMSRLGRLRIGLMNGVATALVAVVICVALAAPTTAQVPDHLKCFKVKDPLRPAGTADLNTPQFGADAGCILKKAMLFCVPATKTNVTVTDKATGNPITPLPVSGPDPGDRICYKAKCPNVPADQSVTDQFGNRTLSKLKASLVCTPAFKGTARYVDNGDGTVTDHYTGLQWEKKDGAGGGANLANPHDVDNRYTWSGSGTAADGTAYTDFLSQLNTCTSPDGVTVTAGFAGHCDWRLPTIQELQTILLAPCVTSPCIDSTFGPTAAFFYWSSTTNPGNPGQAWDVDFISGAVGFDVKGFNFSVRAVRGGS